MAVRQTDTVMCDKFKVFNTGLHTALAGQYNQEEILRNEYQQRESSTALQ